MMLLADLLGTTVLYGVHHGQKCQRSVCLWIDHSSSRVIIHPGRQLTPHKEQNSTKAPHKQVKQVLVCAHKIILPAYTLDQCELVLHRPIPRLLMWTRVLDSKFSLVHVCEEQGNICFPGELTDLAGTVWLSTKQSLLLGGSIVANATAYLINVITRGLRSGQGKGKRWFIQGL